MISGVLLQVVLAGLAQGSVLGLVALGFSLVAGTVRILPFAHGDLVVGSVFIATFAVLGLDAAAAAVLGGVGSLRGALSGDVWRRPFAVPPSRSGYRQVLRGSQRPRNG